MTDTEGEEKPQKIEICLLDNTSIEGGRWYTNEIGYVIEKAHRSSKEGHVPIGKRVLVPFAAALFVVFEE